MVTKSKENSWRKIDGLIVLGGNNASIYNCEYNIKGKDVIIVQTKANRLGMSLLGQAYFSKLLVEQYEPRSIRNVAICGQNDTVLAELAKAEGIEVVVIGNEEKANSKMNSEKEYWSQRYREENTGWDIGEPSPPLKTYIDQLTDKDIKILIPGAGNAYEAEYLFQKGFHNVDVLDISREPLRAFAKKNSSFPKQQLIEGNFFDFEGQYDLIVEQTFFCSFPPHPETRHSYANKIYDLLKPKGKLVGLWFDIPLTGDMEKRPFGGSMEEYLQYLEPHFEVLTFGECYNSVASREGKELFGIFRRK